MLRSVLVWLVLLGGATAVAWGTWSGPLRANERLARQRADLARLAPVLVGAFLSGALAGLWRRERVRSGEGYSSPMLAWLGKRALLASACAVAAWALGPVALDPGWLYAAGAAGAAGAAAYAGNLPVRL